MQFPSHFLWTYKTISQSHSISIFIPCWSTHCKRGYSLCTLSLHHDAYLQVVFRGRTEIARGANVSTPISYTLDGITTGENVLSLARVEKYHLMERMRHRKCGEVLNAFLILFHIQVNILKNGGCKSQSHTYNFSRQFIFQSAFILFQKEWKFYWKIHMHPESKITNKVQSQMTHFFMRINTI